MATELWDAVVAGNAGTLATIKRDGRPQLSDVNYTADPDTRIIRISTRDPLAKVHNLRRDPRASLHVPAVHGSGYAVAEATASLSSVAADEHDATVEELIEVYRLVQRKEHPDWADYRRAMVADRRVVLSLRVERLYGWVAP
ncbi:PPOX class F420-dependent oxidoreductase [Jidongwangia harbinensis]|uniref:PPOX class F420-dependent oxidoreductase n=1 Tax=Jidongwangia harbinensis TaxID=2878561 RepID=UPI001CD9F5AE|nr:PPOX class F420-dependent oxidoreductase [Jidongwangia harbinensis]MCA2216497.1 PPOX class F420-dependent oxidoreductase [Jidongwangia harbinensis]